MNNCMAEKTGWRKTISFVHGVALAGLVGALAGCASTTATVQPREFSALQPAIAHTTLSGPAAATDVGVAAPGLADEPKELPDPYEKTNRSVFEFNQQLNSAIIYPAAKVYREAVPKVVHEAAESFVGNLSEPVVFANDVLQLRGRAATMTLARFALNTTFGFGGLFDVATKENLPRQSGDFGQTLYVWGAHDSSYLLLPIVGPANTRDLFGTTAEFLVTIPVGAAIPARLASFGNALGAAGMVASPMAKLDKVGEMQALEESSIDFYVMMRSVVTQKRKAELEEARATSDWTRFSTAEETAAAAPATFVAPDKSLAPRRRETVDDRPSERRPAARRCQERAGIHPAESIAKGVDLVPRHGRRALEKHWSRGEEIWPQGKSCCECRS